MGNEWKINGKYTVHTWKINGKQIEINGKQIEIKTENKCTVNGK